MIMSGMLGDHGDQFPDCTITIWVIYSVTSQKPPVATFWKGAFTRVTSESTGAREKNWRFAAAKFFETTTKRVIYVFTSSSWDLMGFHNACCCHSSFSIFQHQCFFSRIFKATFTATTTSFEEKLRNHPHWWYDIVGFFGLGRRLCEHRQRIEQLMACQARKISRWAVGIGSDSIDCYVIDGR